MFDIEHPGLVAAYLCSVSKAYLVVGQRRNEGKVEVSQESKCPKVHTSGYDGVVDSSDRLCGMIVVKVVLWLFFVP